MIFLVKNRDLSLTPEILSRSWIIFLVLLVLLLPISPVGIRRTAVEDILETSHDTELTETAVTSEMVMALRVGLFLNKAGVKERHWVRHVETYRHGRTGQHLALGVTEELEDETFLEIKKYIYSSRSGVTQ